MALVNQLRCSKAVFAADRSLPGITMEQLAGAQKAANDAEVVKAVNDTAGIPFTRVVEAMDLTPG